MSVLIKSYVLKKISALWVSAQVLSYLLPLGKIFSDADSIFSFNCLDSFLIKRFNITETNMKSFIKFRVFIEQLLSASLPCYECDVSQVVLSSASPLCTKCFVDMSFCFGFLVLATASTVGSFRDCFFSASCCNFFCMFLLIQIIKLKKLRKNFFFLFPLSNRIGKIGAFCLKIILKKTVLIKSVFILMLFLSAQT